MLYPFLFQPIFQERIWGGRSLERLYKKAIPGGAPIGESWEVVDRPEAQSVITNGPLAGQTLSWLMRNHARDLLGEARSLEGRFPLLVKILDAQEKLSLQVHPPAEKAKARGGEPKTEMWYITDARPGAELYAGLRRGVTRAEFERRIGDGTVAECFHRVPVAAGDAMFLPSGRVHAIGAGLVIFEIQQNSDTTYRVFDWNRVDAQGKRRALHVAESLECIDFQDFEPAPIPVSHAERQAIVESPLFSVEIFHVGPASGIDLGLDACRVIAAVEGTVHLRSGGHQQVLEPGQFCLLPAVLGSVRVEGGKAACFLSAQPGR